MIKDLFFSNGYESRYPVSRNVIKVIEHNYGGLTWKQSAIGFAANSRIWFASILVATGISPIFAVIWVLVSALATSFGKFRFHFFKPAPPSQTVKFVGASVPEELIARYEAACAEMVAVTKELDALPVEHPEGEL